VAARRGLHDLGAEPLLAPRRVGVGLGAAQTVVDVQRGDAVAELGKGVVETRRVGAARDEAQDLPARLDEVVPADVGLDPLQDLQSAIEATPGGR
jgi:hypothetical protein